MFLKLESDDHTARVELTFRVTGRKRCLYLRALDDPIVQWPRTPPSHGGNTGSNPVRVATAAGGEGSRGLRTPDP